MGTEDYERKDFQTRNGFIFNLPVDYELDESEGDLFGIIEIPFDAFSGDSNKNISNQRGGQNFSKSKKKEVIQGLQELLTQSLGGRGPSGPGGRPSALSSELRDDIIYRIKNDINDELGRYLMGGIDIKLKLSQSGLYVNFLQISRYADFQNFHVSIHDTFFNNPPQHNKSMAHTQGQNQNPNNVSDVQSILKLEVEGWDPRNPNNFPPFKFRLILREILDINGEDIMTTAPYAKRMIVKTVNALNELLFIRKIERITNANGTTTWQLDPPLSQSLTSSPPSGGYKRRKYKKTKKRTKNIKKKSRKSRKQKRKTRKINKKKNKRSRK